MGDLTTKADVKAYLNITNATDDAVIDKLIAASSAAILRYVDREIELKPYTEVRDGNGRDIMVLANTPISAVDLVKIDGQVIPVSGGFGIPGYYFEDKYLLLRDFTFTRARRNVEIHYTAGYQTIPADIAQACVETVALRYRERDRVGHQSKSIQGETVAFTVVDFPISARTILANYKRTFLP